MGWLPASLFCSLVLSFTRRPCGPGPEPFPQKVCAVQSQEFCDESAHMFFAVVLALRWRAGGGRSRRRGGILSSYSGRSPGLWGWGEWGASQI